MSATTPSLPKPLSQLEGAYDPTRAETHWYDWWVEQGFFHADEHSDKEPFTILIPPPNITGSLHMGHGLTMTIQDILIRYKRMAGFEALWLPGIDHAGIATQTVVERMLRRQGISRHDLGREAFVERIWAWKEKYAGRIRDQLRVLGSSFDWERERFTMDPELSEAVREVFVTLWEQGLIYRANRLVNWDPESQTVLSNLEVEQEEEAGHLWHIAYPLSDDPSRVLVVATTRPETLLGDAAVAVHPDDPRYQDLIGRTLDLPLTDRKIPIIADPLAADPAFGSGAVKITPDHDFNDWECGQRNNLQGLQVIGFDAKINDNAPEAYRGLDRYEARKRIVADLQAAGRLVKIDEHRYTPGRSQRSGVIVEPLPMTQWYVKMQPLADPAIKAVEDGRITFVPESWSKVYFEWMNNIRDWCISRQLWWGHRIPAWHCADCAGITVSRETPTACQACGSAAITQDEDVLDTWFSSGLWPFTTLGWPEQTDSLKKFYPTSVMETGFDIIFFWVARMIFFGLHIMDEVPFRTVFLHAMVRDKEGQKMSKTKGNVIDPLHVIHGVTPEDIDPEERDNYAMLFQDFPEGIRPQGADALRITLAVYAAQGRDIKLDVKRVEGYRAFMNKLWNASKFALMHLTDHPVAALDVTTATLTPADRWILGRLQVAIGDVTLALDAFRINDAAQTIYNFVWKELCDWYLELAKAVLYDREEAAGLGGDAASTRAVLAHVLEQTLRLLHPICPFITEEIWHHLPRPGVTAPSLCVAAWPVVDEALRFEQEAADLDLAIELINAIRTIRGETNVKSSVQIPRVLLLTDDPTARERIDRTRTYLLTQARIQELAVEPLEGAERPAQTATTVARGVEIHIPLKGLIDLDEETARLRKEIAKMDKEVTFFTKKLANPKFVEKAPPEVLEKDRAKLAEFEARKAALEASLTDLTAL